MKKSGCLKAFLVVVLAVVFFILIIRDWPSKPYSLPEDVKTVKQLKPYVDQYVADYVKWGTYDIHSIDFTFNDDHEGVGTFLVVQGDAKYFSPRSYSVQVDTTSHEIVKITSYPSTRGPYYLDIDNWAIDSDEAVDIAKEIERENGFKEKYTEIKFLCFRLGSGDNRVNVDFYYPDREAFDRTFSVSFYPATGEIINR